MFAVFGVTEQLIQKEARKKMESYVVDAVVAGKKQKVKPTQEQWEAEFSRLCEEMKTTQKPKQLSQKLATPELAEQYHRMTRKGWHRELCIKAHVKAIDGAGKAIMTKTNKQKMQWIPYGDVQAEQQKVEQSKQMDWVA